MATTTYDEEEKTECKNSNGRDIVQQQQPVALSSSTVKKNAVVSETQSQQQRQMLPICCHPDFDLTTNNDHDHGSSNSNSLKLFRITRAKGKALQSQGFGVTMVVNDNDGSKDDTNEDDQVEDIATCSTRKEDGGTIEAVSKGESDDQPQKRKRPSSTTASTDSSTSIDSKKLKHQPQSSLQKNSHNFLFLEEVLFLHEQGMLECHNANKSTTTWKDATEEPPLLLTSSQLYGLLEPCGLEMASYLVYAHLRQQTFRVMRYTTQRLALLEECSRAAQPPSNVGTMAAEQQQEEPKNTTQPSPPVTPPMTHKARRALLLQLRHNVQHAPPPSLMTGNDSSSGGVDVPPSPTFAFCVYPPDANFSKTNPGRPAFLVAITHYSHSNNNSNHATTNNNNANSFEVLQQLLQQAQGIPIKLATVADSGSVVMFGITKDGVPHR